MPSRPGIRTYFLVMLGTVAALPVLGLGWWQSRSLATESAGEWDRLLLERAEDAAQDVETVLRIRRDEIELLAVRAEILPNWHDTAQMRGLFDGRFGASGFSLLYLADPWGTSLVSSPELNGAGESTAGVNYRDRAYYRRMMDTRRPAIGDVTMGRRSHTATVSVVAPIRARDGSMRGFVAGGLNVEQLQTQLFTNRQGDSRIVIVDAMGSVVIDSAGKLPALSTYAVVPQRGPGGSSTLMTLHPPDERERVRRVSAPVLVDDIPWRVYVSTPISQIVAHADAMRRATAWATAGALLATLALVYLVATLASRNLRRLALLVGRVGSGDYTAEPHQPSRFTPHEAVDVWDAMQDMMNLLESQRHERQTLIADLQRANEHSRSLATGLRDAHDGFVVLDRDRRIEYANPAWLRMRDLSLDDVVGRKALELDRTEGVAADQIHAIEAALAEQQPWTGTVSFRRKNAEQGEADLSISPVFNDRGQIEHYVELVRDVTARRHAELAMQQSERLASLGLLAAGVAHEINNPMTYVVGNLEHLSELCDEGILTVAGDPDVDLTTCLADSLHGARRVIEIVADLRALSQSRADTGNAIASGLQIMETCLRMAQSQIRHRAEVVRDVPNDDLWFRISPQRLSQVVLNLILNAVQAMTDGNAATNRLTVSLRCLEDGRGEIAVADTGSGMSFEVAQRIFDPFFTTKGTGSGTGLGLSISHSIVTAAHGEIRVESELKKGTCFRVVLPLADEQGNEDATNETANPLLGLSVLVIDDEPGVLTAIRRMLATCRTATATSVKEALEMMELERYDLVLSDVMMAEVTGVQLVHILRDRDPDLAKRVCLMSGGIIGGELAEAVKVIGVPLLHKPMTRGELHEALRAVHVGR